MCDPFLYLYACIRKIHQYKKSYCKFHRVSPRIKVNLNITYFITFFNSTSTFSSQEGYIRYDKLHRLDFEACFYTSKLCHP